MIQELNPDIERSRKDWLALRSPEPWKLLQRLFCQRIMLAPEQSKRSVVSMQLCLVDTSEALVHAWCKAFSAFPEVRIEIERTLQTRIKEVAGFIPEPIDAEDCQLAMAAALQVALANPVICTTVFCPGMGTGVGRVPPRDAAEAMARAYAAVAIKDNG